MIEQSSMPIGQVHPEQVDAREPHTWIASLQPAQEPFYNPATGIVTMESEQFVALIHRVVSGA
jgi:hypothetical protein